MGIASWVLLQRAGLLHYMWPLQVDSESEGHLAHTPCRQKVEMSTILCTPPTGTVGISQYSKPSQQPRTHVHIFKHQLEGDFVGGFHSRGSPAIAWRVPSAPQ